MASRAGYHFSICVLAVIGLCSCSVGGRYGSDPNGIYPSAIPSSAPIAPIECALSATDAPQNVQDIFPWPLPRGSSEENLTDEILRPIINEHSGEVTLGEVNRQLVQLMREEDAPPFVYYTTPSGTGFAAVTRVDPIEKDGSKSGHSSKNGSWLFGILRGLVVPPEGRSRVLLFLVTDSPDAEQHSTTEATPELATQWMKRGCLVFPSALENVPVKRDYRLYVRSYEFLTRNGKARLVTWADHAISPTQSLVALGVKLSSSK